jgi:hypothetical protein
VQVSFTGLCGGKENNWLKTKQKAMYVKRCSSCYHRVDCLLDAVPYCDQCKIRRLQGILLRYSSHASLKEIVSHQKFALEFPGSRVQKREAANAFIQKYAHKVNGWHFTGTIFIRSWETK